MVRAKHGQQAVTRDYSFASLKMQVIFEPISPATPAMRRDRETTCCRAIHRRAQCRRTRTAQRPTQKGKAPARQLRKARILLKNDVSDAGEASKIVLVGAGQAQHPQVG